MTKEYETLRSIRNEMFPPVLEYKVTAFYGFRGRKDKGIEKADAEQRVPEVSLNEILLMMKGKIMILNSGEVRKYTSKKNTGGLLEHEYIFDIDLPLSIKDQTPETLRAIIKLIED